MTNFSNEPSIYHVQFFSLGQTRLTDETEKNVKSINVLTDWKVLINKMDLRIFVKTYLDKKGIIDGVFKDNVPGNDWAELFIKWHSLTQRLADNVRSSRLQISSDAIELYFQNLSETLEGIPERNIFNYDETNVTDDPSRKKCIVHRGLARIEWKGEYVPPMVVYKAKMYTKGGWLGAQKALFMILHPHENLWEVVFWNISEIN